MCILRTRLCPVNARLFGAVILAVIIGNIFERGALSLSSNAERVGTHIGYKTLYSAVFMTEVHALVKLLGNAHCALRLEIELFGRLLLECRRDKRRCRRLCTVSLFDFGADELFAEAVFLYSYGFAFS